MFTVTFTQSALDDVASLTKAEQTTVIAAAERQLTIPDGREFVLAEVDDFAQEVALVRKNPELMQFLAERSKEGKRYSLDEVKARLGQG